MNHIIHSCTHAHVAKDRPEISTTEMFAGMAAYLQQLLDLLEPRCAQHKPGQLSRMPSMRRLANTGCSLIGTTAAAAASMVSVKGRNMPDATLSSC